jgi:riboflavin synthase
MRVETDESIAQMIVEKGSIAIDGVSLTVIDAMSNSFSVGLIPTTLQECTLGTIQEGEILNIETDILGKYVLKFMNLQRSNKPVSSNLTMEQLREMGW